MNLSIYLKMRDPNVIKEELIYAEKNIPSDILNSYKNFNPNWKATSAHIYFKKGKIVF